MADPVEFEIEDAQGELHEYSCVPHGASEGTELCMEIMAMAGEPIGRLVSANLSPILEAVQDMKPGEDNIDESFDRLRDELDGMDVDLGQVVRDVQLAIAQSGNAEFFKRVLSGTHRDGKRLSKNIVYDQAYQANYMELMKATWRVVKANGFLPLWGII